MTLLRDASSPIVMVDDSADDFQIVELFYARSVLQNPLVHFASSEVFLEYMRQVDKGSQPLPALVLMDVNMPLMSGFEVIASVRSQETFREVPIILMFTNSAREEDRQRAREVGADDFFTKPWEGRGYVDLFDSFAHG